MLNTKAHDWRAWGMDSAECHNCGASAPGIETMADMIERATHPGLLSAGDALKELETAWLEAVGPCPGS